MHDITDILLRARAKSREWSEEQVWKLLAAVSRIVPESMTDWDWDAGERWGRVIRRQKAVAWIRTDFPLLAIRADFARQCAALNEATGVETILVEDYDEPCFSVDAAAWGAIFPEDLLSDDVRLNKLSMSDLWFHTV